MKTNLILLVCGLTLFSINNSTACSCEYTPTFCEGNNGSRIVVLAEITSVIDFANININIIENIHLEADLGPKQLFGQDGVNCGQWLDVFSVGDTAILAISLWDSNDPNLYYLFGCNPNYLFYSNDVVSGPFTPWTEELSFPAFLDSLQYCFDLETTVNTKEIQRTSIEVYPNPSSDYIQLSTLKNPHLGYKIISLDGRILLDVSQSPQLQSEINLTPFSSGIYFLQVRYKEGDEYVRILKE